MRKILFLLLLLIPILAVAQKHKKEGKDSTYFMSIEDTTWNKMAQRGVGATMSIRHTDYKCMRTSTPYGSITTHTEWYKYTKLLVLTDTGWKRKQ